MFLVLRVFWRITSVSRFPSVCSRSPRLFPARPVCSSLAPVCPRSPPVCPRSPPICPRSLPSALCLPTSVLAPPGPFVARPGPFPARPGLFLLASDLVLLAPRTSPALPPESWHHHFGSKNLAGSTYRGSGKNSKSPIGFSDVATGSSSFGIGLPLVRGHRPRLKPSPYHRTIYHRTIQPRVIYHRTICPNHTRKQ